jgi:pimeloyl-ACP methyl ester carboxylesterase
VLVDSLQRDMYSSMAPEARKNYQHNMDMLTRTAAWSAPLGLPRLANQPASVVLDKLPASEQGRARGFAMQSKNYRTLYREYLSIDAALDAARALPPLPHIPVTVLSTNDLSEFPPGWDREDMRQHWIAGQRLLARETGGRHIVVDGAGHYLQLERPALVIGAIREVWNQLPR